MIKAPTGEKISTSTTGNDKPQKRRYKSKQSIYSKKTVTVKTETMMKKIITTKNVEWLE